MAERRQEELINLDGLLPPQLVEQAVAAGAAKGNLPTVQQFFLAVLAGVFIAMGALFCTIVVTGGGLDGAIQLPYGITALLGGLAFCLGLILVVVAGAELFTGNNLMVVAVASNRLTVPSLLRNWVVVYLGNFLGSMATAYVMYHTAQYTFADGQLGVKAMAIANAKCALEFTPAFMRGLCCNALVCLAVWLTLSCRTTTDKILAIIFPITAFVAAGFEHCVANMYFIPIGIFVKSDAAFWAAKGVDLTQYADLTWRNFLVANLVPVTIGNIVGGACFVGVIYWMVYARPTGKGRKTAP